VAWLEELVRRSRALLNQPVRFPGSKPVRPSVAVVTDSAAALPGAWAKEPVTALCLKIVPMPVMVSGQIYGEGVDDVPAALALGLAEGKDLKTSRPSPGLFRKAYEELAAQGFDAVVSVHISSELSGTVEAASLAAAHVDIPVEIVDTRTVAMAEGFAVISAVLAAQAGKPAAEVAAAARQAAGAGQVLFYVPSLEQLRRGGRISPASGYLGTLLSIKPILGIKDGAVVGLEKIRTAAKAKARLQQLAVRGIEELDYAPQLAVHYFGNESEARQLADELAAHAGNEILLTPLPSVLAAHAGLGVLAVVIGPAMSAPES
jgi:DegV family protein with EDD domain